MSHEVSGTLPTWEELDDFQIAFVERELRLYIPVGKKWKIVIRGEAKWRLLTHPKAKFELGKEKGLLRLFPDIILTNVKTIDVLPGGALGITLEEAENGQS